MIKLIELVVPREGMSKQAFHDHWRHPHATIAMDIRLLRGYVQGHGIASELITENPFGYAGAAEAWFDSVEQASALQQHPRYIEALGPDEPHFLQINQLKILLCTEQVVQSGRSAPYLYSADADWSDNNRALCVKLLQFVAADTHCDWNAAQQAKLAYNVGAFRHVLSRCIEPGEFTGVRELFWPTLTAFETGVRHDPDSLARLQTLAQPAFSLLVQAERII